MFELHPDLSSLGVKASGDKQSKKIVASLQHFVFLNLVEQLPVVRVRYCNTFMERKRERCTQIE